jgi:hypothetical protein
MASFSPVVDGAVKTNRANLAGAMPNASRLAGAEA